MKKITYLLVILCSLALSSMAFAGSEAGKDSARYYKSHPVEFDGKHVDVDCVMVTRINGGPQVDGVAFFVAHTKDDDNQARGGSIVVAVLEDKADSFVRKYGDTVDRNRGSTEKVDSKRLRGVFNVLDSGHVYIDVSGGEAHELILEHKDSAKGNIGRGDGGVLPSNGKSKGKKFKQ
ncbi:MAG TPA: hypothetical protein DCX06_00080 [Opitutae bacterium]|nr:hypothetical protein [Opitutae bacterium]